MFLTDRQKQLLSTLLVSPDGISIKKLETQLHVSRRTVYREFNNLKTTLVEKHIEINNDKGKYYLSGKKEDLNEVKKMVYQAKEQTTMSINARENAIAARLLLSHQPCKIIQFALDLNVSEATIQKDLDAVEKSLTQYQIKLIRKNGVGLSVEADEIKRRQIFVQILVNEINEYAFFEYLHHENVKVNVFLRMLDKDTLFWTAQSLKESIIPQLQLETDQKLIRLIITFATTIERIKQKCSVGKVKQDPNTLKYQGYVYRFLALYEEKQKVTVNQNEINYLANKIKDYDYQRIDFQYENEDELEFSARVKKYIRLVSEKMKIDFLKHPIFVNHLTQHIYNLLNKRVASLPDAKIESLTGLSQKFADLYQIVQEDWQKVFPNDSLTSSEMQLILVYFAKELTSQEDKQDLSALVICENGIGTSAILKARLKQEIPEIKSIKISRVSELNRVQIKNFDLILSTIKLKDFTRDYQLVSPLLLNDEILQIKAYLRNYESKYLSSIPEKVIVNKRKNAAEKLSHLSINSLFFAELVNGVKVQRLEYNSEDLIAVIQECLVHTDSTIIRKQIPIAKNLLKRIRLAPVGLPNSHIALLHTRSQEITRCSFAAFDLDNEISLKAMDHNDIMVKRILLMLSPAELSEEEQAAMSLISSMIIMNDENLKLFTAGSQKEIKDAIATQFINELKNKLAD